MGARVALVRPGLVPYGQALAMQLELRQRLLDAPAHEWAGYLIALEHPTTITLGKRGKPQDILTPHLLEHLGVPAYQLDRGGELTCHEPGQLVLYPIVRLDALQLGVVDLIRDLAHALAQTLLSYGVSASYDPQTPGLWTPQQQKIASVGMRVHRGVTMHGAAINLTNDLSGFQLIVPCGMPDATLTTLAREAPQHSATLSVDSFLTRALPALSAAMRAELVPHEEPLIHDPSRWPAPMALTP